MTGEASRQIQFENQGVIVLMLDPQSSSPQHYYTQHITQPVWRQYFCQLFSNRDAVIALKMKQLWRYLISIYHKICAGILLNQCQCKMLCYLSAQIVATNAVMIFWNLKFTNSFLTGTELWEICRGRGAIFIEANVRNKHQNMIQISRRRVTKPTNEKFIHH